MDSQTMNNTAFVSMEKPTIYYTTTNMEKSSGQEVSCLNNTVYQVMSLPKGYTNEEGVKELFENTLQLGVLGEIKITEKKNYNRRLQTETVTYGAIIEVKEHKDNLAAYELYTAAAASKPGTVMLFTETPFCWENGETMTHLSVRIVEKVEKAEDTIEKLELQEGEWASLYIPYIHESLMLETRTGKIETFYPRQLSEFIERDLNLGKVSRVDFVDRNDTNESLSGKSAYIHFKYWHKNNNVEYLRNKLNEHGTFRQRGYYDGTKQRSFYSRDANGDKTTGYLLFKINHKPIPEVSIELNVHQLAAANEFLENELKQRDERIAELEKQLEELTKNKEP